MNKAYNRINWENYPSDSTPLNENNLNKMDVAIDEVDNRVISLDTTKLPVATAYTMVKDVEFDEKTGVFTITKLNGSVIKIDTALEKISTNFRFDHSTQKLILTLIDGTTQEVDLSALLTQYEFTDSDTIAFTIDTSGKVVASVKKGSITQDMLEPNYLANIKVEVAKAESASLSADTSAKNAKTSETNAKTSEEKAREYAEAAGGIDALISSFATGTNPTIQDSTNAPLIYGKFKGYTLQDGEPTPDNPIEINGLAKDGAIEVKACGKNLLNYSGFTKIATTRGTSVFENNGVTITATENDAYTNFRDKVFPEEARVYVKEGKSYTLSWEESTNQAGVVIIFPNGLVNNAREVDNSKKKSLTYIATNDVSFITFRFGVSTSGTTISYRNIQIEVGDIATEYEPYTETTTAITTGAPLYEGDYIEIYADGSGKLVRARKSYVLDGDEDFTNQSMHNTDEGFLIAITMSLDKGVINRKLWCDHFSPVYNAQSGRVPGTCSFNPLKMYSHYLYFNVPYSLVGIDSTSTEDEKINAFKAWLSKNPVTVVYELAEPTETPLTAEQIAQFKQIYTFEPVTNVFCDGEVELLYYKNTDNGETVWILHKKAEKNERAVNSVNNHYSSFKQTFDTVVGGTVSENMSNVEYTEPSFSGGSMYYDVYKGNTLVNGLKSATAKIAETLSSMCDFFIGKIAYNIGGKEIIDDFDYENWIVERAEGGGIEYPSNTLERFERLIAQCVEASIKLNDSLKTSATLIDAQEATTPTTFELSETMDNYLFLVLHTNWYSSVYGCQVVPANVFKSSHNYDIVVYGNNLDQYVRFKCVDSNHVTITSSAEHVRGGIIGFIKK